MPIGFIPLILEICPCETAETAFGTLAGVNPVDEGLAVSRGNFGRVDVFMKSGEEIKAREGEVA